MFAELYREEKREEGDRGGRRIKSVCVGGGSKGERQMQPVISSLNVLHCPEHTGDS